MNAAVLSLGFTVLILLVLAVLGGLMARRMILTNRQQISAAQKRIQEMERDKAELQSAREEMRHYAEHDDLTGLWNHRIILERLRQEVDRARRENTPLSVIMVDLDHFKKVNDSYGHRTGDLVLKVVGKILQRSVRSYDWVGRYGGEEFLLILPGSGFAGARIRAERLRKTVQEMPVLDGEVVIPVTASFGVAAGFPSDWERLILAADAALYRAKENGRNCVIGTEILPAAYGPQTSRERRPKIVQH
jgi:diguanylate cyclase (GGDEF)-like protein